jgi:thiaminase
VAETQAHLRGVAPEVLLVSAADKLHNARTLVSDLRAFGEPVWSRFNAPRSDTLWNYRQLVETYRSHQLQERVGHLVDELDRTVQQVERWPDG